MYMLRTGMHPFYVIGDTEHTFIWRISQDSFEIENSLESLEHSLFIRLCSRSTQDRYIAHQAIKHPWITRNFTNPIPLT